MTPNRSKASKDRNLEIIDRHLAGESVEDLAAEFGLSASTVYHIVVRIKRTSISGDYPVVQRNKPKTEEPK